MNESDWLLSFVNSPPPPAGVDHLVITGDLTNLALESEYRRAAEIVGRFGSKLEISVVPGNHDIYTDTKSQQALFQKVHSRSLRTKERKVASCLTAPCSLL